MGNGKSHSTAAGNFIDQMLSKTRKIKGGKLARRKVQAIRSEQGSRSGNSPWLYVECLADIAEPIADIIRSEPSLLGFGPHSFHGKDHAVPAHPLAAKKEYVLLQLERRVHRQSSASSTSAAVASTSIVSLLRLICSIYRCRFHRAHRRFSELEVSFLMKRRRRGARRSFFISSRGCSFTLQALPILFDDTWALWVA